MSETGKRERRKSVLILEEADAGGAENVSEKPARPGPQDAPQPPDPEAALAEERAEAARARRGGLGFWTRLLLWAGGLLFSVSLAVSVERLVTELLESAPWLAWSAAALAALALLALLALVIQELAALGRLRRIEGLRQAALMARAGGAAADAQRIARDLEALYAGRRDLPLDWARLRDQADDAVDADARLALYERRVMAGLDEQARAEVRRAAKRVATITALAPSVLLDAAAALYFNLAMIRRLGEIYGGRSGLAGTWRLARRVVEHAMAVGLIALGDDLLEPLLGGGVASKLSRRLGEGVVNGAMTARIGLAAMEVTRPLPFHTLEKPKLRELAWEALRRGDPAA